MLSLVSLLVDQVTVGDRQDACQSMLSGDALWVAQAEDDVLASIDSDIDWYHTT